MPRAFRLFRRACAVAALAAPATPVGAGDVCNGDIPAAALQQLSALRQHGASCGDRGRFGAAPGLAWHPVLEGLARQQADWLADFGMLVHTGRDGQTISQRASAAGYRYARVAENLGQGQPGVADVLAAWTASAGHCANLHDPAVTEMALACAPGADGRAIWVLVLGRRL